MFNRSALSGAVLLLTVATPVFAQDAKSSTAAEDVIQDPMPRSSAAGIASGSPVQTKAFGPSARPTAPVGEKAAKDAPTFAISTNPATLLLGSVGVEFDGAVNPDVSLFVSPSFVFGSPISSPQTNVSVSGFGLEGGLRYFAGREAPKGFWFGPYVGGAMASATAGTVTANATGVRFGGMIGYSWIPGNFYLSLGAGGGYELITVESSGRSRVTSGPALALRFAIGVAQ